MAERSPKGNGGGGGGGSLLHSQGLVKEQHQQQQQHLSSSTASSMYGKLLSTSNLQSSVQNLTTPAFLEKLYEILETPSLESIIAWQPDGQSFIIKKPSELQEMVLPRWFKHNNLQSFVRQLNMYSFSKTRHDSNYREFRQPMFQRGRRDLLPYIRRKAQAALKASAVTNPSEADLLSSVDALDGSGISDASFYAIASTTPSSNGTSNGNGKRCHQEFDTPEGSDSLPASGAAAAAAATNGCSIDSNINNNNNYASLDIVSELMKRVGILEGQLYTIGYEFKELRAKHNALVEILTGFLSSSGNGSAASKDSSESVITGTDGTSAASTGGSSGTTSTVVMGRGGGGGGGGLQPQEPVERLQAALSSSVELLSDIDDSAADIDEESYERPSENDAFRRMRSTSTSSTILSFESDNESVAESTISSASNSSRKKRKLAVPSIYSVLQILSDCRVQDHFQQSPNQSSSPSLSSSYSSSAAAATSASGGFEGFYSSSSSIGMTAAAAAAAAAANNSLSSTSSNLGPSTSDNASGRSGGGGGGGPGMSSRGRRKNNVRNEVSSSVGTLVLYQQQGQKQQHQQQAQGQNLQQQLQMLAQPSQAISGVDYILQAADLQQRVISLSQLSELTQPRF